MRRIVRLAAVGLAGVATSATLPAQCVDADLLVAGGSEAAVADSASVRAVRRMLVRGAGGHPGVAIIAWQDLTPDDPRFAAANLAPLPSGTTSLFYGTLSP